MGKGLKTPQLQSFPCSSLSQSLQHQAQTLSLSVLVFHSWPWLPLHLRACLSPLRHSLSSSPCHISSLRRSYASLAFSDLALLGHSLLILSGLVHALWDAFTGLQSHCWASCPSGHLYILCTPPAEPHERDFHSWGQTTNLGWSSRQKKYSGILLVNLSWGVNKRTHIMRRL